MSCCEQMRQRRKKKNDEQEIDIMEIRYVRLDVYKLSNSLSFYRNEYLFVFVSSRLRKKKSTNITNIKIV